MIQRCSDCCCCWTLSSDRLVVTAESEAINQEDSPKSSSLSSLSDDEYKLDTASDFGWWPRDSLASNIINKTTDQQWRIIFFSFFKNVFLFTIEKFNVFVFYHKNYTLEITSTLVCGYNDKKRPGSHSSHWNQHCWYNLKRNEIYIWKGGNSGVCPPFELRAACRAQKGSGRALLLLVYNCSYSSSSFLCTFNLFLYTQIDRFAHIIYSQMCTEKTKYNSWRQIWNWN